MTHRQVEGAPIAYVVEQEAEKGRDSRDTGGVTLRLIAWGSCANGE